MNFHDALELIQEDPTKIIRSNFMDECEGVVWFNNKAVWWPHLDTEPFPFVLNDEFLESEWEVNDIKQLKETSVFFS